MTALEYRGQNTKKLPTYQKQMKKQMKLKNINSTMERCSRVEDLNL